MVHLTRPLLRITPDWYHIERVGGAFFKKQNLFYLTRYYKGIGHCEKKNARNRFQYYLKGEMWYDKEMSQHKLDVNRARIAAAAEEYGYNYHFLKSTLPKLDIQLSLKAMGQLAIYEPKTFRVLVDICKEYTSEELRPANFNPNTL